MQIGTFRKNVMKTVAVKPAKLGLRTVSKNTLRTNVIRATVALKADVGNLMQALSQYILGMQFTQAMKDDAFLAMGDIGYDLTFLCRSLKVKMPAATKKSKLQGTRTAALLQFDGLTNELLSIVNSSTFAGPKMTKVKKIVVLPNKGGVKEEREVDVVDTAAENTLEQERQAKMQAILKNVVDLYWRLSFDIFQHAPSAILDAKFQRMQKQEFQNVQFDIGKAKPATAKIAGTMHFSAGKKIAGKKSKKAATAASA